MSARATSARSTRILESPSYGLPEDDLGSPTLWSPITAWSPNALEMCSMDSTKYSEDLSGTWIFHAFQTFNSTRLTLFSLHNLRL